VQSGFFNSLHTSCSEKAGCRIFSGNSFCVQTDNCGRASCQCAASEIIYKMTARLSTMLFSESRYDFQGACGPIFGILSKQSPTPKVWVPIIPNLGPLCALGVDHPHIGFQKKT
jgi:hypothetical protein